MPPHGTRVHEAATWSLAAACAFFALVAHRPNVDDSYYVNASVGAVDNSDQAVLKWDTLHGMPGTPILLPAYRVHSIELLVAGLSKLTGIEAIVAAHVLLPVAGAVFCCLAWARLLRMIVPVGWIWALAAIVLLMLVVGSPTRWYGNFALMRLQQGKSLLVTAGVPLLIAYAVQFVCRPGSRSWILLAAAQITAMGLSSTALWLAPTVVGLAAVAAVPPAPRRWKTLLLAGAASAYVLAAGLAVRAAMSGQPLIPGLYATPEQPLLSCLESVFGNGWFRDSCLAVLLLSWYFCPTIVAERLCTVYPLGVLLTVLNPYFAARLAAGVVGGPTFFRTLWVLPLPVFIGIVLAAPMIGRKDLHLGFLRPAGWVAGVLALLLAAAPCLTLSRQNDARIGWPGRKVPAEYAVAARIVKVAPPRAYLLRPKKSRRGSPRFTTIPIRW